jgi:hypothetical protein
MFIFPFFFNSNSFSYQSISVSKNVFITPNKDDSIEKGTNIFPSGFSGLFPQHFELNKTTFRSS